MTVDILAAALVALMIFLGWRSGAVTQVVRVTAAVLAVVLAPVVSQMLGEVLLEEPGAAGPGAAVGLLVLAVIGTYVAISLSGWLIVKAMRAASENLSRLDRIGGSAIGGMAALILVWFLLTAVVLLRVPLERVDPQNAMALRGGAATGFVERHDLLTLWNFPELERLHTALKVGYYATELDREHVLREHARATDFLRREAIRPLVDDPALMQAVLDDQYAFTLADPRVRAVLADDETTQKMGAVDWTSLLAEIQSPMHAQ